MRLNGRGSEAAVTIDENESRCARKAAIAVALGLPACFIGSPFGSRDSRDAKAAPAPPAIPGARMRSCGPRTSVPRLFSLLPFYDNGMFPAANVAPARQRRHAMRLAHRSNPDKDTLAATARHTVSPNRDTRMPAVSQGFRQKDLYRLSLGNDSRSPRVGPPAPMPPRQIKALESGHGYCEPLSRPGGSRAKRTWFAATARGAASLWKR